jgi:hypothetical protein
LLLLRLPLMLIVMATRRLKILSYRSFLIPERRRKKKTCAFHYALVCASQV